MLNDTYPPSFRFHFLGGVSRQLPENDKHRKRGNSVSSPRTHAPKHGFRVTNDHTSSNRSKLNRPIEKRSDRHNPRRVTCTNQSPARSHRPVRSKKTNNLNGKRVSKTTIKNKSVTFGHVTIQEYPMILGDHPCVREGPPVTIDWNPMTSTKKKVDRFEIEKKLKTKKQTPSKNESGATSDAYPRILSAEERQKLLKRQGYSTLQMQASEKAAAKIRFSRMQSCSHPLCLKERKDQSSDPCNLLHHQQDRVRGRTRKRTSPKSCPEHPPAQTQRRLHPHLLGLSEPPRATYSRRKTFA